MQRIQIVFPESVMERLRAVAQAQDRPVSEQVRRAVDRMLEPCPVPAPPKPARFPTFHGGNVRVGADRLRDVLQRLGGRRHASGRAWSSQGRAAVKSLDTNILLDAANEDCPEHPPALRLLDEALAAPRDWILADQVLAEMYLGLRHPRVSAKPLSAGETLKRVAFLSEESGFSFCCHQLPAWPAIRAGFALASFPRRRTHDHVLAVTLKSHGVTTLYTRNVAESQPTGRSVWRRFSLESGRHGG